MFNYKKQGEFEIMAVISNSSAIKKVKATAVVQKMIGWILAVINGLLAIAGTAQITQVFDFIMVLILAVPTALGVLLILKGRKKTKLIKTFYDYSARLSSDSENSIDLLAASTGATVAKTEKNLSDMISFGFLQNCYIDTHRSKLVLNNQHRDHPSDESQPQSATQYVTIRCKGCGAANTLASGRLGECEFCGMQLTE